MDSLASLILYPDIHLHTCIRLVNWLVFNGISAQIGFITPWSFQICHLGVEDKQLTIQTIHTTHAIQPGLCGDNLRDLLEVSSEESF